MLGRKIGIITLGLVLSGGLLVGCGGKDAQKEEAKVTISGSTSLGPVMELLGEKYHEKDGVTVEVQQIGSSAGIKNAIDGVTELGMSSRKLKDEEKKALDETKIAIDGIALITNKKNDVKDLTMAQVKDIYTGKIKNWKEVGGKDAPIVVCSREDGSGTRDGFQEIVGFKSEELLKDAQISDGSGNIKSTVEGNENAIGYISFGYVDDKVNALKIDGVEANDTEVKADKYPLSRPFIVVNKKGEISETAKKFLDYILSPEGQEQVKAKGFITIK